MSWRDDPALVRRDDATGAAGTSASGPAPDAAIDPRFEALLSALAPLLASWRVDVGPVHLRVGDNVIGQARRVIANNPDEARAKILDGVRLVVSSLQVEPGEIYEAPAPAPAPPGAPGAV